MLDFIIRILNEWQAMAVIFMIFLFFRRKDWLRVDNYIMSVGISYLVFLFGIRIAMMSAGGDLSMPPEIVPISLIFVFLEDIFFVALPTFISSFVSKKYKILVWTPFVCFFSAAHMYQGYQGAVFALLAIYVGYRIGTKYGFGTSSVLHIFYDISTFYAVKIAYILSQFK